jgi:hypothetical protein
VAAEVEEEEEEEEEAFPQIRSYSGIQQLKTDGI